MSAERHIVTWGNADESRGPHPFAPVRLWWGTVSFVHGISCSGDPLVVAALSKRMSRVESCRGSHYLTSVLLQTGHSKMVERSRVEEVFLEGWLVQLRLSLSMCSRVYAGRPGSSGSARVSAALTWNPARYGGPAQRWLRRVSLTSW